MRATNCSPILARTYNVSATTDPRRRNQSNADEITEASTLLLLEKSVPAKTVIPKPQAKGDFIVKRWGRRRDKRALTYAIQNHRIPGRSFDKGITVPEWEQGFYEGTAGFTGSTWDLIATDRTDTLLTMLIIPSSIRSTAR